MFHLKCFKNKCYIKEINLLILSTNLLHNEDRNEWAQENPLGPTCYDENITMKQEIYFPTKQVKAYSKDANYSHTYTMTTTSVIKL